MHIGFNRANNKRNQDQVKKFILLISSVVLLSSISYTDLIDLYKKGELKVVPDPHFGSKTPWQEKISD